MLAASAGTASIWALAATASVDASQGSLRSSGCNALACAAGAEAVAAFVVFAGALLRIGPDEITGPLEDPTGVPGTGPPGSTAATGFGMTAVTLRGERRVASVCKPVTPVSRMVSGFRPNSCSMVAGMKECSSCRCSIRFWGHQGEITIAGTRGPY